MPNAHEKKKLHLVIKKKETINYCRFLTSVAKICIRLFF